MFIDLLTKPVTPTHSFIPIPSILAASPSTGAVTLDVDEAECFTVLLARAVLEEPDPAVVVAVGVESARDFQACPGDKVAVLVGYGTNNPPGVFVFESCELLSGTSGVSGASGSGRLGLAAGAWGSLGTIGEKGSSGVIGLGMGRGGGGIKAAEDVATKRRHNRVCGSILEGV
ncbi:unnamed protein product [Alternaria sp. RS040]